MESGQNMHEENILTKKNIEVVMIHGWRPADVVKEKKTKEKQKNKKKHASDNNIQKKRIIKWLESASCTAFVEIFNRMVATYF